VSRLDGYPPVLWGLAVSGLVAALLITRLEPPLDPRGAA